MVVIAEGSIWILLTCLLAGEWVGHALMSEEGRGGCE
jgi:hypothetical protein